MSSLLDKNMQQFIQDHISSILNYILNITDLEINQLFEIVHQYYEKEADKLITTAERLRAEGKVKGRKEGRKEGKRIALIEMTYNLLK